MNDVSNLNSRRNKLFRALVFELTYIIGRSYSVSVNSSRK